MIVETLGLQCFLGYRDLVELDFKDKQVIGIAGANESGKSTLLRAIRYALYGKAGVQREVALINDDADAPLVVRLGVRLPSGELLEIERGRTKGNEAIMHATGIAGSPSEVHAEVLKKIGLDYKDFIDLSYFVQGDIHGFMHGDKRAYFQRWTRPLQWWAKLEAEARAVMSDLEGEAAGVQAKIDEATRSLEREDELRRWKGRALETIGQRERDLKTQEERVVVLRSKIEAEESSRVSRQEVQTLRREVAAVRDQIYSLDARTNDLEVEVTKTARGVCPILNIGCEELGRKSAARRKKINQTLSDMRARREKLVVQEETALAKVEALDAKAKRVAVKDPTDPRLLATAIQQERTARSDLNSAQREADKCDVLLGLMDEKRGVLATAKSEMAKIEAKIRRARFVAFMCGKSGVPSTLIQEELDNVEDRCNWILDRLGYPKRIRFSAFKELAGFEKVCPLCGGETWRKQCCSSCGTDRPRKRKDEPTVTIFDGKRERAFELESGGGQVLQSFAVRLSGAFFVSAMTGVPLHMLMLDEVFAMLDASNRQRLMALVLDRLISEFGIRQQFVVSHHDDVVNAVDDLLLVEKKRGRSHVGWA